MKWEIFVLEYARSRDQPVASLLQNAFDEGTIDLPFAFVLARHGERAVLIDTGFMREPGGGELMAKRFGIAQWVSPLRLLAELGVAPDQVTDIVLSHAHYDHMGSIHKFPDAHLYLQKQELLGWIEVMALPRRFRALSWVLNPEDIHHALDAAAAHRLTLLEGDRDDVVPGIHVRFGPGHTMGQQFVVVESESGRYVVSGDCVYCARNLTGTDGDGVYIPLGSGIGGAWDQLKSFDRINDEIAGDLGRLLILHDFDRWARFPVFKELEGFRIFKVA